MALPPGTRLGPFEVLSPLGSGGMGEVYRARDSRLNREIALKVLPEQFAQDAEARARFEREAQAVAALSHPNILGIFDFGSEDGLCYAAMELLEGESLRDRLAGGALPARKSIEYALQIALGLAAAHERGIVHRDLKPENIFVVKDGRVKVLDFGLAKSFVALTRAGDTQSPTAALETEPGTVLGTIGYMSPEQVRGSAADHRSDIFAFGVVLQEMLSGRRPFSRETAAETMTAILREDPPELPEESPGISPGLRAIVRHCLEKSPDERFQSARDIAFDLQMVSGSSVSGSRFSGVSGAKAPSRRFLGLAALAGGLVAGSLLTLWLRRPPANEAPTMQVLTYSGRDQNPAVSPDGKTIAFSSSRDGTPRIWLKQVAGGAEAPLTSGPDDNPRFSPDGTAVVFTRFESGTPSIFRVALLGGEPRKLIDNANEADWSPDGRRICFVHVEVGLTTKTILGVASPDGGDVRTIAEIPDRVLSSPRWSPDGARIAAAALVPGNVEGKILLVDARTGRVETLPPQRGRGLVTAPAFAASGRNLVFAQTDSVVGVSGSSASRILSQKIGSSKATTLLWTPGQIGTIEVPAPGTMIFNVVTARSNIQESPLGANTESRPRWLTRGSSNDRQPRYSPDGEWIIFSSNRSGNLDLWEISTRTGIVRRLTEDAAEDWDPAFTPDGKEILWSSKRSGNFEIWMSRTDGTQARQVSRDGFDAENPVISPDGKWIVYVSYNPATRGVWKIHPDGSGATRVVAGQTQWPEISPDGRYIAYYFFSTGTLTSVGTNLGGNLPAEIRVCRLEGGAAVDFRIPIVSDAFSFSGRLRWMPDGKAIAFVGANEKKAIGVFAQDFVPGADTSNTRRALAGFDPDVPTETLAISPDGRRIATTGADANLALMSAQGIAGLMPPHRAPR